VLWVYDFDAHVAAGIQSVVPSANLVGCELADASLLLPLEVFLRLQMANVSRQHIKDIIGAAALGLGTAWPAIFSDLKLLWIPGRVLRSSHAVVVGCEPCKAYGALHTSRQFHIDEQTPAQPWLGFLACGGPLRHSFFHDLSKEFLTFWTQFADRVLSGRRKVVDFSQNSPLWMRNTTALQKLTDARPVPAVGFGLPAPPTRSPDPIPPAHTPRPAPPARRVWQEQYLQKLDSSIEYISPRRVCPLPSWSRGVGAAAVWGYAHADLEAIIADPQTLAVTRWTVRQSWSQPFMHEVGGLFWTFAATAAAAAGDEERLRVREFLHAHVAQIEASLRGCVDVLILRRVLVEASAVIVRIDVVRLGLACRRADAYGIMIHAFSLILQQGDKPAAYDILIAGLSARGGDPQRSGYVVGLLASQEY